MTKYAPVYMHGDGYDGPDYALVDLTLSAATFEEASAEDTAIGTLSGMSEEDSSLSLILAPADANKVKLDGEDLVVGSVPSADGTLTVTVRETNPYGTNTPHDTEFEITVTAAG